MYETWLETTDCVFRQSAVSKSRKPWVGGEMVKEKYKDRAVRVAADTAVRKFVWRNNIGKSILILICFIYYFIAGAAHSLEYFLGHLTPYIEVLK